MVSHRSKPPAKATPVAEALQSASRLHFTVEDQEDPQRFDFERIRSVHLVVTPTGATDHWRLGIEFSDNRTFSGWRYGIGHPLWHLTKNSGDARLLATYYNERGQGDTFAIQPYGHESVDMDVRLIDGRLHFRVAGLPGYARSFPLAGHRMGRLFAWADGRPYELDVDVQID